MESGRLRNFLAANNIYSFYFILIMKTVEVKTVKNKGKGVFALKDFKEGQLILNITGKVIQTKNPSKYPEEFQEHWAPLGKRGDTYRFITPKIPWMYMNHSCDSNAGVINDRKLFAKQDIKKGEEITVDYSAYDLESLTGGNKQLSMKCMCGSKNCRKVIATFDKLKKKDRDRLKKYLSPHLKRKYL